MSDRRVPAKLKERLIRENIEAHMALGMSEREAREIAPQMFEEAVRRAQESGAIDIPPGSADQLLSRRDSDPKVREMVERRQAEGATVEDCRRWWNLAEVERQMLHIQDDAAKMAIFMYHGDQGLSEEEAWRIVRKALPTYGDPDEIAGAKAEGWGDDRPLPPELKFRVMTFIEGAAANPDEFTRRAEASSSFNAFVRSEMRAGRFPVADSGGRPAATSKGTGCLLSLVAVVGRALGGR